MPEKREILNDPDKNLLNKRWEIISQCCHQNHMPSSVKQVALHRKKMLLPCNDFVTSVARLVIKQKIVKLFK